MKRPLIPKDEKNGCSKWRSGLIYTVIFFTTILAAVCLFDQIDKEKPILSWNEPEVPVGQELLANSIEQAVGKTEAEWKAAIQKELQDGTHLTKYKESCKEFGVVEAGNALLKVIQEEFDAWKIPGGHYDPRNQPKPPAWKKMTDDILKPMLKNDPKEPTRNVLMLWSGDYRFNPQFRDENTLFRLELTPFGRAMGKILGNAIFASNCGDAAYLSFVGSIYDKASSLLVNNYVGNTVVVALSEKLGTSRATFEYKTFFRQELPSILSRKNDIKEMRFFVRNEKGVYINNMKDKAPLKEDGLKKQVFTVKFPSAAWDKTRVIELTEMMLKGETIPDEVAVSVAKAQDAAEKKCTDCLDCGHDHPVAEQRFGCASCGESATPWKAEYDTEIYG